MKPLPTIDVSFYFNNKNSEIKNIFNLFDNSIWKRIPFNYLAYQNNRWYGFYKEPKMQSMYGVSFFALDFGKGEKMPFGEEVPHEITINIRLEQKESSPFLWSKINGL